MKTQIDSKRLKQLEKAEAKLNALENGGVDNWEWYDQAMTSYNDSVELEEKCEQLLEDIECSLLVGVYEPSERGAGFAASDDARQQTLELLIGFANNIKTSLKD